MFKIANLHPDFSAKRGAEGGDRNQRSVWERPSALLPAALPVQASGPMRSDDEARAFLLQELEA